MSRHGVSGTTAGLLAAPGLAALALHLPTAPPRLALLSIATAGAAILAWRRWRATPAGGADAARSVGEADAAKHGDADFVERSSVRLTAASVLLVIFVALGAPEISRTLGATSPEHRYALAQLRILGLLGVFAFATLPLLLAELTSAHGMGEPARVAERIRSSWRIAIIASLGAGATMLAASSSLSYDAAPNGPGRPSAATRQLVASLEAPHAVVFLTPGAPHEGDVLAYLEDLTPLGLTYQRTDRARAGAEAAALGVDEDGVMAIRVGERRGRIVLGRDTDEIARHLTTLDLEMQRVLLGLVPARGISYRTIGHGELGTEDRSERPGVVRLRAAIAASGLEHRDLGVAHGLGGVVPGDADVVLVLGPTRPLAQGVVRALSNHVQAGKGLFVAIDPNHCDAVTSLLDVLGAGCEDGRIVLHRPVVRRHGGAQDRTVLIVTSTPDEGFASHPAVATLAHAGARAQLVVPSAGALSATKEKLRPVIHAGAGAFLDRDADLTHGDGEPEGPFVLALGGSTLDQRVVVFGSVEMFGDDAMGASEANLALVRASLSFLSSSGSPPAKPMVLREPSMARIDHGRAALLFALPAALAMLGLWLRRRP